MYRKKSLSVAVAAAIAATTCGQAAAAQLEEIIVTATKRTESMQDVAVSVRAMSGDTLRELHVETFDKYIEYLPNVVSQGNGPGKKEIYIRGSVGEQASITGPTNAVQPGVALYVDEMPISMLGRNLDYYAADLERIEVLSGPQGTLFGASSEAGTMRLITAKPKQGEFEAGFNSKFSTTEGGSESAAGDAFINIPFTDKLAVRAVIYTDHQGGWIDNVLSSFTPNATVIERNSLGFGPPLSTADTVESAFNDELVEDDWNDATYRGGRFGLAYQINDDWDVLVQHTAQSLTVDGTFLNDPTLGDDQSAKFSPDTNSDDFGLTTWTLNGRLGQLDVVYTGGYLDREVDSTIDYTFYNNTGGYILYYICGGNVYDATDPNNCYDPTKTFKEESTNERWTHEIRISNDADNRFRFIAGGYYNDVETTHIGDFNYASTNQAFQDNITSYYSAAAAAGFLIGNVTLDTPGTNTSGPRGPETTFFQDITRTEEEFALFGNIAFDLTDQFTVSFGARYYDLDTQIQGASNFSFGCRYGAGAFGGGTSELTADGRCNGFGFSGDVSNRTSVIGQFAETGDLSVLADATTPRGSALFSPLSLALFDSGQTSVDGFNSDGSFTESDTIFKATLDWKANENILVFATWAEGYRPATINRSGGAPALNQTGVFAGYAVPTVATTDTLTSYELGLKSDLLDSTLRLNATFYHTKNEDLQIVRIDPTNVAFLFFAENVGTTEVDGLDVDFQWAASDRLTITGAFTALLDAELTEGNPQLAGSIVPVGSELPYSADFAGNLRVRYDFPLSSLQADGYVSAGISYRGETVSAFLGNAELAEDIQVLQNGVGSGLELQFEGGTFGSTVISDGAGGTRLPLNARYVNPSSTTLNAAIGMNKDGWGAELFVDNLTDEGAPVVQIIGKAIPEITRQRPRTIGLRFNYYYQ